MANELLHELAPLLAEEGIDVPDNMEMSPPVGQARELAAVTMRLTAEAIADGNARLAALMLDQAQPESPDGSSATVSAPDPYLSGAGLSLAAGRQSADRVTECRAGAKHQAAAVRVQCGGEPDAPYRIPEVCRPGPASAG